MTVEDQDDLHETLSMETDDHKIQVRLFISVVTN